MSEPKKISFGFSKISKKPSVAVPKKSENEIQFIDCIEGNSIKLLNGEEEGKKELVIPLKNENLLRDNMVQALKSRLEEKKKNQVNNDKPSENGVSEPSEKPADSESEKKPLSLDELAAKEILEDLKKSNETENVKETFEIPTTNVSAFAEKESTLEDYENIPVTEFGLAMLRGMGWAPEKGVGKNGQIVAVVNPVLRPKGMGLGADKALPAVVKSATGEELVMKKNAPLKINSGPYKNLYGKIEGFDELPGRMMVRLTLQNSVISISENLVQLVTTDEFNKNSKILNLNDYNQFKEKDTSNNVIVNAKRESDKVVNRNNKFQQDNSDSESDMPQKSKPIQSKRNEHRSVSSYPHESQRDFKVPDRHEDRQSKGKTYLKKKNYSSDSEDESSEDRGSSRSKKLDKHRQRRSSSEPEEKYRSHKSNKGYRDRSPSSDNERRKTKSKNNYSSSDDEKGKKTYQDNKKSYKSYSKTSSRHKKRDSSNSDSDREVSREKKKKSHKHKKHRKHRSDSSCSDSVDRERKHKKHSSRRSRSRTPSRKHSKKHHSRR